MININPSIFKAYDIRGIYPTDLNEEGMDRIIRAIYTFFKQKTGKDKISVLLGRDMRISSPNMTKTAINALLDMGAQVIDGGLLATPTFYYAVFHYGFETGIQITASHNPKEYTGTKFVINTPQGLLKIGKSNGMEDIKRLVLSDKQFKKSQNTGTIIQKTGITDDEVDSALKLLDNPQLKKFNIVADPANAMAIIYLEATEKKIPMNLIKMNFTLDGTFPAHQPDPLQPKNLVDLQARVLQEKADLGLAPDGDGDRLMFIDEKGNLVPPTIISAIVARDLLKKYPGEKIVIDIRYLLTPKKIIEENGGQLVDVRVGHAFITEKLQQTGAIFGGESSGHYYFKYNGGTEAQVVTLLTVLNVMTKENKTLSELVLELQRAYESGEYNYRVKNAQEIMEHVKEKYKDGLLTTIDCIEISYPDWRFSIRTSNTEPLLRLNVEGYDKAKMEEKLHELINLINKTAVFEEPAEH